MTTHEPQTNFSDATSKARSATENIREKAADTTHAASEDFDEVIAHLTSAVKSGSSSVARTIEKNPTLFLAGLVAAGAVTALVIRSAQQRRRGPVDRLQNDILQQTASLRNMLQSEVDAARLKSRAADFSSALQSVDLKPYIDSLVSTLSDAGDKARSKVSSMTKT